MIVIDEYEEPTSTEDDWLCIYGCIDYHMSDCPTRGNYGSTDYSDYDDNWERDELG